MKIPKSFWHIFCAIGALFALQESVHASCDKEVYRKARQMCSWIPHTNPGKVKCEQKAYSYFKTGSKLDATAWMEHASCTIAALSDAVTDYKDAIGNTNRNNSSTTNNSNNSSTQSSIQTKELAINSIGKPVKLMTGSKSLKAGTVVNAVEWPMKGNMVCPTYAPAQKVDPVTYKVSQCTVSVDIYVAPSSNNGADCISSKWMQFSPQDKMCFVNKKK